MQARSRIVLAAALAGLALVAAALLLRGQGGDEGRVAQLEPRADAPASEVRAQPGQLAEPIEREEPAAAAPRPTCTLRGRVVVRGEGSAVAHAAVALEVAGEETQRLLEADAEGRFELTLPAPAELTAAHVLANPRAGALSREVDLQLGAGEVPRGVRVAGRVVDDRGQPIAGAQVLGWCRRSPEGPPDRRTVSAYDGGFALDHLGEALFVEAQAEGHLSIQGFHGASGALPRAEDLLLVLARVRPLRARAVGPDGLPVEGAVVELRPAERLPHGGLTTAEGIFHVRPPTALRSAATGPDGVARFEQVPRVACALRVGHPELALPGGTLAVASDAEEVHLELVLARRITGRVVDLQRAPVEGAEVELCGSRLVAADTTDARGRFALACEPEQRGDLQEAWIGVRAQGFAVHLVENPRLEPGAPPLEIALERGLALAGRVLAADGSPAAGAHVAIEGDRRASRAIPRDLNVAPTWEHLVLGSQTARTGEDGRFRFELLYPGTFQIAVVHQHEGSPRRQSWTARAGDEELELRLDPSLREDVALEGRVTDALSGAPVGAFEVIVLGLDEQGGTFNSPPHAFESADGSYRIGALEPMQLSVLVRADGYADRGAPLEPRAPGVHRVDVALAPLRVLALRLVDQRGEPLAHARVMVSNAEGRGLWLPSSEGGKTAVIFAGEDGRAILQDLPAEPVTILVHPATPREWPEGVPRSKSFQVDLRGPVEDEMELAVELPDER